MAENASSALRQIKEEHLLEIIKMLGGIEHLESIPSSERPYINKEKWRRYILMLSTMSTKNMSMAIQLMKRDSIMKNKAKSMKITNNVYGMETMSIISTM
jgi:hypothetical protein